MLSGQLGKFTEKEAREMLIKPSSNAILHLVSIGSKFGVLYHSVCDMCQFCETQGDCRGQFNVKPEPYSPMQIDKTEAELALIKFDEFVESLAHYWNEEDKEEYILPVKRVLVKASLKVAPSEEGVD